MLSLTVRSSLLLALTVLAGCGGSNGGYPLLATVPQGVAAPCATAFDGVSGGSAKSFLLSKDEGDTVPLSSCTFDAQRNVTIGGDGGCGPRVVIDQSFTDKDKNALGKITIAANGKLAVPHVIPGGTLEVETAGILVAGSLSIGTESCPVGGDSDPQGRVKVTFTGSQIPSDPAIDSGSDKGIEVRMGGILRLYGAKGAAPKGVSWTHLSRPAGPTRYQAADKGIGAPVAASGERQLYLASDVRTGEGGGWKAGDWIVVATSSFSPFESEFVQIASVDGAGAGSLLTLVQPLRHYHFGGADPGLPSDASYGADASTNYGVDERSEVGLISRSISFTSRTPATASADPLDQNHHWGGEIRMLAGFAEAKIQGVELEKFGKARLGSYPIHFHMTGKAGPHRVESNSIHHSYNKCVTVHMSQGVSITHNVCARAVGHLFYQEIGDEQGGQFIGNLGIGAMSHHFGIDEANVPRTKDAEKLVQNWWEGDNLARVNGYDGLNVPNTDKQTNPTHGRCFVSNPSGRLDAAERKSPDGGKTPPPPDVPCNAGEMYVEQSSGFWVVNPGTVMEGNSIAGCQGMGKGYWYVPPQDAKGVVYRQKFEPVGSFRNNRVHACYDGLFGETDTAAVSDQLFPTSDGKPYSDPDPASLNVIAHFKGLTATRIRNRGVWMRPLWTAVEDGRFATNRDSVSLVSSGGNDGNAPGVWALLKDSVLVGLSTNNVDRWGPCPPATGDGQGCVDMNPKANELNGLGYQSPRWNSAGYMIYDGPVRIIHNHFVNYLADISPLLTKEDQDVMKVFRYAGNPRTPGVPPTDRYEGDAALGWFQNNQSAYPTASVTKALSFDNVDLRHQIYTERVNLGDFRDGDKNTAVIDLDGTLTGYQVVDANGVRVPGEFPISLNNLPFNRNANAVDECLATGQQDAQYEGRATSLISPANMATLEFEALHPSGRLWQNMLFTKDSKDHNVHQSMELLSRDGRGIWEPKVASGVGYSVQANPSSQPGQENSPYGMPKTVRVGFTDAVKSDMQAKPFYVRVGICYTNAQNGPPAAGNFTITRGYKSWGGNGVNTTKAAMRQYFNQLENRYGSQTCHNLDSGVARNLAPGTGCPAEGVTAVPAGGCPAGSRQEGDMCVFPRTPLTAAASITDLLKPDGKPADTYFYDGTTGMLFFYVQQDSPNARGPSPLGSCSGDPLKDDPACPREGEELETYYSCPPQGCINYSVELKDSGYTPGPSNCARLASYELPEPVITNQLAYVGGSAIVKADAAEEKPGFLHWVPRQQPNCPTSTPALRKLTTAAIAAPRTGATLDLARWWRDSLSIGSASASRWSKEWFSAKRSPIPDVGAMTQICSAAPA